MNKKVKRKWLKALRTLIKDGGYRQGQGRLCTIPNDPDSEESHKTDYSFCCLGVLQNLYHEEKGTEFDPDHFPDGQQSPEVNEWADLNSEDGKDIHIGDNFLGLPMYEAYSDHLAEMNDMGANFRTIANWIEKNL